MGKMTDEEWMEYRKRVRDAKNTIRPDGLLKRIVRLEGQVEDLRVAMATLKDDLATARAGRR